MKLKSLVVAPALNFATTVLSQLSGDGSLDASPKVLARAPYTLWYDILYDQNTASLNSVACWTLIIAGYETFGDLPSYPSIGGAPQITTGASPYCGTCWELTYTDPNGVSGSVNFTAINTGPEGGYSIAFASMDSLTNGYTLYVDGTWITATQLPESDCGLSLKVTGG